MARAKAEDKRIRAEELARRKAKQAAAKQEALELKEKLEAEKAAAEELEIQRALEEISRKKQAEDTAIKQALELAAKQQAEEKEEKLRAELAQQKRLHAEQAARAWADEERIEDALRELAFARETETKDTELAAKEQRKKIARQEADKRQAEEKLQREFRQRIASEQQLEEEARKRAEAGADRLKSLQRSTSAPQAVPTPASKTAAQSPSPVADHKPLAKNFPKKLGPAAPNLFNLHPFRNTDDVRQRAEQSAKQMKTLYLAAIVCLLVLIMLGTRQALLPAPPPPVKGADFLAVDLESNLFITAGSQLFTLDRAGVATGAQPYSAMGLSADAVLVGLDADAGIIFQQADDSTAVWETLRCELLPPACQPYPSQFSGQHIAAWIVDPRTHHSYAATPGSQILTKLAGDGTILGQAHISMPDKPGLALNEGLLYLSRSEGPGIGIFRQDDEGFGQQLDEVLLIPPAALKKGQSSIEGFVRTKGSWWATLANPDTGDAGLYLFNTEWEFISSAPIKDKTKPEQLLSWSNKVLVADSATVEILRFNLQGQLEAPLIPTELEAYIEAQKHSVENNRQLWQTGLGFLAMLSVALFLLGRLAQLRVLVYKRDKVYGADAIDDKVKQIHWVDYGERRVASSVRLAVIYGLMCLAIFVTLIYLLVPVKVILAAALVMLGPAIALSLLYFSRPGHIGVWKNLLVLVDHNDNYHLGGGARVHHRGNFILLDDVVVFMGSRYIQVFSPATLATHITPIVRAGVKVDTTTLIIKLIQGSHPVARGLLACFACMAAAIICLLLL